jgi:hypothetical protein
VILDLSAVTDGLVDLVKSEWTTAPIWAELGVGGPTFTPKFSGLAPDRIRAGDATYLSVFLYHAESNNAQEAMFWRPELMHGPGQPIRYLPLALDLFYLVSAYSEASYVEEQQAMSVAMRIFHANAVVRSGPPSPPAPGPLAWQLTLSLEHRSYDELSRLWQATTVPLRLGVVYRAAVLFIAPDANDVSAAEVLEVDAYVQPTVPPPPGNPDLVKVTSA